MKPQHRFAIIALLLLAAGASTLPRRLVHATPPSPSAQTSDCVVTVTHSLAPPLLLAGEQAEVTMRVEPYCPIVENYMHVVFALPATDALSARELAKVRDDVHDLIDKILAHKSTGCCGNSVTIPRIGIATYDSRGQALCQLMDDPDRLKRCADRMTRSRPGNDLGMGIRTANGILLRARTPGNPINEVLIVVAGGESSEHCQTHVRSAGSLKSQGVLVISVCASDEDCDRDCIRQVASSARYFYSRINLISPIFERIRCECINISLRQLQWSTTLAPDLVYVEESSSLPVESREADAALAWSQNFVPKQGLTLTYRVQPKWLGFRRITFDSALDFRDNMNRSGAASASSTFDLAVFRPFHQDP